ncbi:transposable element Tcb2 transposase [Trichonephila clavipes]|nr:transposable element Tcb2 transposase [Trichonephila clavipes]
MRVLKQWTHEHRTTRKTGSGTREVTSARDDRHLLHMVGNERTASSKQLAARWSTGVLMSASSIHRRLLHRGLRARDHDGCIIVRRYAGERCLPECVIERHSDLTPGIMVWGSFSYHGRSNFLRIEGNRNSNSNKVHFTVDGVSYARTPQKKKSKDDKIGELGDQAIVALVPVHRAPNVRFI